MVATTAALLWYGPPVVRPSLKHTAYPGHSPAQVNGAGKSTMIKLLTGEMEPCEGIVWKHPNTRVAYVAQHAFHHVEQVGYVLSWGSRI